MSSQLTICSLFKFNDLYLNGNHAQGQMTKVAIFKWPTQNTAVYCKWTRNDHQNDHMAVIRCKPGLSRN